MRVRRVKVHRLFMLRDRAVLWFGGKGEGSWSAVPVFGSLRLSGFMDHASVDYHAREN